MQLKLANVQEQYDKDSNLHKSDIAYIKEWVAKQPHLPALLEIELIHFLHCSYYSLEMAKETIDNFYTMKTMFYDIFGNSNQDKFKAALNEAVYTTLPTLTPGYLVFYMKYINCDPNTYSLEKHIKYAAYTLGITLLQNDIVNGLVILFDMEGVTLSHATKAPITVIKNLFSFLQEALPVRLKAIHLMNSTSIVDTILSIVKPFFKLELLNMLHLHTKENENLYKYIPLECFPRDYGGSAPSIENLHRAAKSFMIDNHEFIEVLDLQKVDESKRLGQSKNSHLLFGVDGSFKKLELD